MKDFREITNLLSGEAMVFQLRVSNLWFRVRLRLKVWVRVLFVIGFLV